METPRGENRISAKAAFWAVAALTAIAAALRFYGLDSQLWYDEVKTLLLSVRPPLAEIVTHFPSNNDHPLFSVLSHISISVFGEHPWSLRLPAALFGALSVPMLYIFARKEAGRAEALLAAGLLAVSFHHIAFSQNARGYAMLLFFTLLTSWLVMKALREPSMRVWIFYALAAALGAYTHLTMAYVIAGQGLAVGLNWLLGDKGRFEIRPLIRPFFGFLLVLAVTLALYAPLFSGLQDYVAEKSGGTSAQIATPGWAVLAALEGVTQGFGGVLGAALSLFLLAVGAISYLRRSPVMTVLFFAPVPLMLVSMLALGHAIRPRFLFVLGGFLVLMIVRGAFVLGGALSARSRFLLDRKISGDAIGAALIALVALTSLISLPAGYATPKQDLAGAVADVENRRRPEEPVYIVGGAAKVIVNDYYERGWPMIESAADFNNVNEPFWIVFTFREYVEKGAPELWSAISSHCEGTTVFKAMIGGGDAYVMKCAPAT